MAPNNLRPDLLGGLTAAIVALPLALAFGVASGAGALAGLYGAVMVGFFAAVTGGTPSQISGPTGPMTVVMAMVLTHFTDTPATAFLVVSMGGLFQILFGFAGLGRYIKLVPYPVVSGFMNGIGCIIILLQIPPLLGYATPDGAIVTKLVAMPDMAFDPQWVPLALGTVTLALMFAVPARVGRYLPAPLLALGAGTALSIWLLPGAPVIGEIPTGLPALNMPTVDLNDVPYILRFAVVLAFLGSIDSLLTSLVADSMTGTRHDPNRELIGQGIGNLAAGFIGGLPGAGATMRTVVNIRSGGRGRLSGAFHALVLGALVLGFGGAVEQVPLAVLAGILMKVGIDIIDWRYLKRAHRAPRAGVIIMLVTLGTTVFVDLITAVAVGIVMACVLFVARMANAQMETARLAFAPDQLPNLTPEESEILTASEGRIMMFSVEGPLSFGSAKDISFMLRASYDRDILIIDFTSVPFIDSSASIALEEVIEDIHAAGGLVVLCAVRPGVREVLDKVGVTHQLDPGCIVSDRHAALLFAKQRLVGLDAEPIPE